MRNQPIDRGSPLRLRELTSSGFDISHQGVVLSGLADHHRIAVVVTPAAIGTAFPTIATTTQCVAFVERNLVALKDIANGKLRNGNSSARPAGVWSGETLVEVTALDILRSKRWLTP